MPIVSSQIIKIIPRAKGAQSVFMRHIDQVGRAWDQMPTIDIGVDVNQELASFAVKLSNDLPNREAQEEAGRARNGISQPAQHQTQPELDKSTISLLMQIEDSLEFSQSLQWFRDFEVRAGANNNARASYLGVSNAEYGLVSTRYNQITGLVDGLEADAARVWNKLEVW